MASSAKEKGEEHNAKFHSISNRRDHYSDHRSYHGTFSHCFRSRKKTVKVVLKVVLTKSSIAIRAGRCLTALYNILYETMLSKADVIHVANAKRFVAKLMGL